MGNKKRKSGVVNWDKPKFSPERSGDTFSCLPVVRGTADLTEVLRHLINENGKALYQLGYEHGKAWASISNVVAVSDEPSDTGS